MLKDKEGMATLGVKNIQRAAEFYEGKLGFTPMPENPEPTTRSYRTGKTAILVYESQYAGTNEATAVTWDIGEGVEALVKDLAAKGVPFEHYDFPETTRDGDIHLAGDMKLAWFKDPDGNIHALMGR
jgi:catechol 2,3-dioxygenase-like lactoylglutathione lyase family enzyme